MKLNQIDPKVLELLALPAPDQIGVVVRDIPKAIETYTKFFNWGPFEVIQREFTNMTYRGKPAKFKFLIALAQLGPIQLELMQPLEGNTIYDEFLKTRGEGLHHFGVLIDHIEDRIAAMKKLGIEVLQSGERPGRKWAYMDTEALAGFLIELRERT